LKTEIINTLNGEKFELIISSDGYCFCPVCGEKSNNEEWRPYDETGLPSYDICKCGFQFGYDDSGVPPYEISWANYRQKWLNNEINQHFGKRKSKEEKINQLKNIGL
jgi:hypothetical protein